MGDPGNDFDFFSGPLNREMEERAHATLTHSTPLPFFELYVLRLIWALEHEHAAMPDAPLDDVARAYLMKLIHECRAFSGTVRAGSAYGWCHHTRALIELAAQAHYLFGDPEKTERRLEKWHAYPALHKYAHRRSLELRLAAGEISKEQFDRVCMVAPMHTDVPDATLSRWRKLFRLKKGEITAAPASCFRSWTGSPTATCACCTSSIGDAPKARGRS